MKTVDQVSPHLTWLADPATKRVILDTHTPIRVLVEAEYEEPLSLLCSACNSPLHETPRFNRVALACVTPGCGKIAEIYGLSEGEVTWDDPPVHRSYDLDEFAQLLPTWLAAYEHYDEDYHGSRDEYAEDILLVLSSYISTVRASLLSAGI